MTANGVLQLLLYLVVLLLLAKPLGAYMARVYEGAPIGLDRALGWLERLIYRLVRSPGRSGDGLEGLRADDAALQRARASWSSTSLQRVQGVLPLNPQGFGAVSPDSSFNTAVSFATNTNWQGYGGESTHELSHPDARAHRPELRLRGQRHGRAGGAHPRVRPPLGADHRQLLGGSHADHALHPASAVRRSWRWSSSRRAWSRRSGPIPRRRWSSRRATRSRTPTRTASPSSTRRASPRPRNRR